mmetsp:Transcript_1036/g.2189  ORF Transcript_1036/g.2189 Transcript_1036/m.2189 type:complete len:263 (+) Transcript_1036:302-1090(+)
MQATQGGYAERRPNFENTLDNFHTHNDRILLVENVLWEDLDNAGEHGYSGCFFASALIEFIHESSELIEQMVNDIGSHNSDAHFGGVLTSFTRHFHIKCKDGRIFRVSLFVHDGNLGDIALLHRTNANGTDRDWGFGFFTQELQKSFERSKSGSLHQHTQFVGGQLVLEFCQIGHDLSLDILFFIVGTDHHNRRTSHDLFQVVTNYLDAKRPLDFFVVNVFRLDTHFATWWRRQQPTNFCHNWSIKSAKYSLVPFPKVAIDD